MLWVMLAALTCYVLISVTLLNGLRIGGIDRIG